MDSLALANEQLHLQSAYKNFFTNTVIKGTMSAGRVYDKINDTQEAEIILMDKNSIIAKIIF